MVFRLFIGFLASLDVLASRDCLAVLAVRASLACLAVLASRVFTVVSFLVCLVIGYSWFLFLVRFLLLAGLAFGLS